MARPLPAPVRKQPGRDRAFPSTLLWCPKRSQCLGGTVVGWGEGCWRQGLPRPPPGHGSITNKPNNPQHRGAVSFLWLAAPGSGAGLGLPLLKEAEEGFLFVPWH